jgi:hypothetical protein
MCFFFLSWAAIFCLKRAVTVLIASLWFEQIYSISSYYFHVAIIETGGGEISSSGILRTFVFMCWNTLKERVGAILFQSNHGNQCINPSRRPIIMLPTVAALAFCAYLQETRRPILSHVVVVYNPFKKKKQKKTCVCVCVKGAY